MTLVLILKASIEASGSCPSATHTSTITINDLPTVGLVLTPTTVCTYTTAYMLTGGTPTGGSYSGTGVGASIFNLQLIQMERLQPLLIHTQMLQQRIACSSNHHYRCLCGC
ncbi:MAG: hypothetical protein R2779_01525 [Crocinitomicaceae bacterium]